VQRVRLNSFGVVSLERSKSLELVLVNRGVAVRSRDMLTLELPKSNQADLDGSKNVSM
jgi:hypothetical protein